MIEYFENPDRVLEVFFRNYFTQLNDEYLQIFACDLMKEGMHPVEAMLKMAQLVCPEVLEFIFDKETRSAIILWVREEMRGRQEGEEWRELYPDVKYELYTRDVFEQSDAGEEIDTAV